MSAGTARRTRLTGAIDALAVVAVTAGLAILAGRAWRGTDSVAAGIAVTAMVAAGYVMADLVTGFVHWFCDTFFEEDSPVIGGWLNPLCERLRIWDRAETLLRALGAPLSRDHAATAKPFAG